MNDLGILLIDDEAGYREILAKRLRKQNFKVICVGSGEEALEIIQKEHMDIALLDVQMPGMNGQETLCEIKKLMPTIEVIMLTGQADMEIAQTGIESGAFDYVLKPVDFDELVYKLQDAGEKRHLVNQLDS